MIFPDSLNEETVMEEASIKIDGMTCDGCVRSVKRVMSKLPGVALFDVSLAQNQVTVSFDPQVIYAARIIQSIENAGYEIRK
jgi:copper chaperone